MSAFDLPIKKVPVPFSPFSVSGIIPLPPKERDIYDAGHIAILKDIHDEIHSLVFAAYG